MATLPPPARWTTLAGILLGALLFGACGGEPRGAPPGADTAHAATHGDTMRLAAQADTTAWAGRMLFELSQLAEGVRYAAWRRSHPDGECAGRPATAVGCVTCAMTWRFPGGIELQRAALFFTPEPSAPPVPPRSGDSALAECLLGEVDIRVTAPRPPSRSVMDSLRRAVEQRYAAGVTDSAGERLRHRWRVGARILVVQEDPWQAPVVRAFFPPVAGLNEDGYALVDSTGCFDPDCAWCVPEYFVWNGSQLERIW